MEEEEVPVLEIDEDDDDDETGGTEVEEIEVPGGRVLDESGAGVEVGEDGAVAGPPWEVDMGRR